MTSEGNGSGDGTMGGLRRRAFELGLEVGEENHLESVGWVNSKLQEIREEANRAGVFEEVREAYQKGKKLGVARRSGHTLPPQAGFGKKGSVLSGSRITATGPRGPRMPKPAGFIERIPPEVGLKATVNVMTFVAGRSDVKRDLNALLAGILDVQERIMGIEKGDSQRETFERCLHLLSEVGWVEKFDLDSFDDNTSYVAVRLNSAIAEAFGQSDEPVCQPVCTILETVGRRALGRSVKVVETECVAQGKHACRFEITLRDGATTSPPT
jgi:predicted hydrocarbon binding protein